MDVKIEKTDQGRYGVWVDGKNIHTEATLTAARMCAEVWKHLPLSTPYCVVYDWMVDHQHLFDCPPEEVREYLAEFRKAARMSPHFQIRKD